MQEFYEKNKKIINKLLLLASTIIILYVFFNTIFRYVAPFVFGFLLSVILNPFVNTMTYRLKINRGLGAIIAILGMYAAVGFISTSIISRILREGQAFLSNLPAVVEYTTDTITEWYESITALYRFIPAELQNLFSDMTATLLNSLTSLLGSGIKTGSTSLVSMVPNLILGILLCTISAYFFIKDRTLINESIAKITPDFIYKNYKVIKKGITGALAGYFKAQLIMMSIIFVICTTGMMILRIPYALFLGIIIAIVDALPVFGSGFFYWPWIAFSLITGDYKMAVGLGIIYVLVLLTRQILEPRILGKQIGIHPLMTLMSIYIGLRVFGVFGIFLGPCVVVIIKAVIEAPIQT